jgi:flavin reductase (DIM6/NTAB) family NADH-FMN oxidoreductase RutF
MNELADTAVRNHFKYAMRRLASTVTIVTTEYGGKRHGMVATAVCSLGIDPPSLIASIAQTASLHDPLIARGRFCVNLLTLAQADLISAFSGQYSGEARFQFGNWDNHQFGAPTLRDAQASLICDVSGTLSYAGHTVFIGKVTDVHVSDAIETLLYQNGSFAAAHPI